MGLREMVADVNSKRVLPTSIEARIMSTSIKLESDGGYQLTDTEKTSIALQLREARGPGDIPLTEAGLLVQMVHSMI